MMEKEKVRKVAIPGEIVGDSKTLRSGRGTYEEDGKIISKFVGIPGESEGYKTVVPLSGVYIPRIRDKVIGTITEVERMGWIVDINSPWKAFLSLSEGVDEFVDLKKVNMKRFFDIGDKIYCEIVGTKRGDVQLTMKTPISRKLRDGVIVKITPSKVPRLIGKAGSMVNLIKEGTKTIIRIGQNGLVWVSGENVKKAIKAVEMIDEKSHIYGLTDEISKLLSG